MVTATRKCLSVDNILSLGRQARNRADELGDCRSHRGAYSLAMRLARFAAGLVVAHLSTHPVLGQGAPAIPDERVAAREWFRDAKFGMFVHWGVYSQLGQGEWVMENRAHPRRHVRVARVGVQPREVRRARRGSRSPRPRASRYITITARHHDGFSMFATKATRYNIVDWTPFARDPMKELADECRANRASSCSSTTRSSTGIIPTTGRADAPDARLAAPSRATGIAISTSWTRSSPSCSRNYGPIGGIWFDGMWDKPDADWRLDETYALIHRLQPAALIVPNHHKAPLPGEDVQTFEQDLPGANTAGFNTKEIGALPLETSLTMNQSWGFNITDKKFKSMRELIGYLVRAAGNDANLLLNIGPRPDGTIQPEAVERLRAVGEWLRTYGASIYGTRGGPVPPRDGARRRGAATRCSSMCSTGRIAALAPAARCARRSSDDAEGRPTVDVVESRDGVTLTLPPSTQEEPDRVVVLVTKSGS